jgi:hypothetical protein
MNRLFNGKIRAESYKQGGHSHQRIARGPGKNAKHDPAHDRPSFGGASVGDLIQWQSNGTIQFNPLKRVRFVSDDGNWVQVEGSQTGIPINEVIVEQKQQPDAAMGGMEPPHE